MIGLGLVAPASVSAQNESGGFKVDLTARQTVRASDNLDIEDPAVGGVRSITSLDGTISSVARDQSFVLDFAVGAEVDGDGFRLGNTGVGATYVRRTNSSELELNARYFVKQIREEFQDEMELETIIDSGTQTDYGYGGRVLFGREGPLSLEVSVNQAERQFDSPDPDAVDSSTTRARVVTTAALDPATTLRGTLSFEEREEDDAANQVKATSTAGVGITRNLGNAITASADLNWTRIATTETDMAVRATEVTTGVGGRIALERDLTNGSASASLERKITEDGTVDELRIGRTMEFPASTLFLEGGVILSDGSNLSPLIGVNYQREMRDGSLSLSVSQTGGLNGDDEATVSTRGNASLTRNINAVSSVTASIGVRNDSVIGGGDTTRRIDGALTYRRELAPNTTLDAGYEHARIFETGTNERVANTLFVTFSRGLSRRP